jgi:dipeptidyl aminopeptidase/acylaminoacyl peptidase
MGRQRIGGGVRRAAALAGASLAALCLALPGTAGAVLSGVNGRIAFASGRGEADDTTAKIYLRSTFFGTGGPGTVSPAITGTPSIQHRHPTWSPDRTKIAYAAGPTTGSNFDIFILDLTTPLAVPQNVTNSNNVTDDRPAWSPDGTRIAFDSENTDTGATPTQLNIKIYDVGTGNTTNLTDTTNGTYEHDPAWTPDSQTLFYTTGNPSTAGEMNIVREPAAGGTITPIFVAGGNAEFQPSVSPDGTQLCFTRGSVQGGSDARVFVSLLNGGGQTELPGTSGVASYNCTWSPDGTRIAYVQGTFSSGDLVMEHSDLSGGLVFLETTANRFDGNPEWAPDGRPTCADATVKTAINDSVSVPLSCADTGPAYERTGVIVDLPPDAGPAHGTLGPVQQGNPATVTYTPNSGFTGTDTFQFRSRDDLAFGGRGTATISVVPPPTCKGKPATVFVGPGGLARELNGTSQADVIVGTSGRDRLGAGGGNDLVCAGGGKDTVKGGGGKDKLFGQGGKDKLFGQGGKDKLVGGGGADLLSGGGRADTCVGGPGKDALKSC